MWSSMREDVTILYCVDWVIVINMALKKPALARVKKLIKQIAGKSKELDDLYPDMVIRGKGYISCYCPLDKLFIKIRRGTTVYMVDDALDHTSNVFVYTILGNLIEIDEEELIVVGFD